MPCIPVFSTLCKLNVGVKFCVTEDPTGSKKTSYHLLSYILSELLVQSCNIKNNIYELDVHNVTISCAFCRLEYYVY